LSYYCHGYFKKRDCRKKKGEGKMGENQIRIRYDQEGDILYILVKDGGIKDTVEIGEDVFVEVDEEGKIAGVEVWRARRNIFRELVKYMDELKETSVGN